MMDCDIKINADNIQDLLESLGINSILFLSATARLGWSLVMKGFYKFEKWESMMESHLGSLLRENTDLTDEQIAEFIRDAWEMEMDFRGQSKRVSEWAADLQTQEVDRLHKEIDSLKHELTQVRGELAKTKDDLIQSQDKVIKLYEVINEYNEDRYGSIVE